MMKKLMLVLVIGVMFTLPTLALADSITPSSYSATVGVGGTTVVHKTVTVSKGTPTAALLDVMFIIDTTGSMGPAIAGAKSTSTSLLAALGAFGNVASGDGYSNDPLFNGVLSNLTTNAATTVASINTLAAGVPGGGGDTPEQNLAAIDDAAKNASWRAGSNRFIIMLTDASSHVPPATTTVAADLAAKGIKLIGIDFSAVDGNCAGAPQNGCDGGVGMGSLATGSGGAWYSSSTSAAAIAAAITSGITASFQNYSTVSVSDLGAGLPGVGTSVVCTSAAPGGSCSGDHATGTYDRSVDRTFEFDVTFTGLVPGTYSFTTHGLVDGGSVANEADTITVTSSAVPEPTTLVLLGLGLAGVGFAKRRNPLK
jgi:hypothetical protein